MADLKPGTEIDHRYRVVARIGETRDLAFFEIERIQNDRSLTLIVPHTTEPDASVRLRGAAMRESARGGDGDVDVNDAGTLPDGRTYVVAALSAEGLRALLSSQRVLGSVPA